MKHLMLVLTWSGVLICSQAVMADEQKENQRLLSISILLESENPAPGDTQELALIMTPQKGWHGYWLNPGDVGFPTKVNWLLPEGVTIGEMQYPTPSQLVTGDFMNYIYPGEYTLLTQIVIDKNVSTGSSLPIALDVSPDFS